MSTSTKFETFNNNIKISQNDQNKISSRYKRITKRLNLDFWGSNSETSIVFMLVRMVGILTFM